MLLESLKKIGGHLFILQNRIRKDVGFVNREIHSIFSAGMLINFVNPGYQPFSCFPVVTASLWVCQRHLYTIPATLQTVCKVLQRFPRKALQVSVHRYKSTLGTVLCTCVASQPVNTHAHVCYSFPPFTKWKLTG